MLQLRTSASSSSLTPLLRLACSTPTTILVTKLSTSTDALITSSDDLRHSTHTYDNYNNRSEQPRFPASRMWAHAYVPSASVERCRQRSCVARNAARRKGRAWTKRAAFGRHTGPRSGLNLVKSGSANDWSGIEGEEGVGVGRDVTKSLYHISVAQATRPPGART